MMDIFNKKFNLCFLIILFSFYQLVFSDVEKLKIFNSDDITDIEDINTNYPKVLSKESDKSIKWMYITNNSSGSISFGTNNTDAYRGDWGYSISNTVSNILYSPCWGFTQPTNYSTNLYPRQFYIIRYYATNYYSRNVIHQDGGAKVLKSGYYAISASTIFAIYSPSAVSLRYYLIKINKNGQGTYLQAGQYTLISNAFEYYYTSLAGIHYLNSEDTVFFGVYSEVPPNYGYTNQWLYGYPHFSGYYLGE